MRPTPLESQAEENRRLRACLDDLVRIMTLPILSTGGERSQIASTLLDALLGTLQLSFAFIRLTDLDAKASLEMMRIAKASGGSTGGRELRSAINASLGDGLLSQRETLLVVGNDKFSVASRPLGVNGELGVVVAGSRSPVFPHQTEIVVLAVASNQAAIALQAARVLNAEQTREVATPEQRMARSEHESWMIIDSIPGPIVLLNKFGDVEMVNRHLLDYFGATIEEARQWGTNDLVQPDDLAQVIELFTRSIDSGVPYESEYRLRRSDGVYRWFQSRGFPLHDANGEIDRWCVLLTDIDDRKRAEEAVRASERNLKLIIDTIPAIAWSACGNGSADFFSEHYLDYVGLSLEELQDWGWTSAVHPDDLEGLVATWKHLMSSEQAGEAEARFRRFDGSYRWFLFRANPLRDQSGKIMKWYGANLDIEDRKRGEEDLHARELSWRQIVDNVPGLVATMGALGNVEFLNRQTLEYFGKSNAELKDWSLIGAVHPDDLPRIVEARAKSIETGRVYDVEHRCRRADGVYRWFQVRGLPVRSGEAAITGWYLLLTDIDDRKRAEEALISSERNLSQMINAIRTHVFVLHPDGSVLDVNQGVLDYSGLTLAEMQREDSRARFFHPEDVERLREERRVALTETVPFENEQRCVGKDGRYRWFLARYNPVLDEQGKIDRWYVAAFDIDDRKRAEAELRQAHLQLTEAQRLSKTGSFITDLVGDDHNWSDEAYRIFELDPATKVSVELVRKMVHHDDLPSFESAIARGMAGVNVDFAFRIVTAKGATKHLRGVAHVTEHPEGRPMFVGALQDVTESTVAEEALDRARSELTHVARITSLNALTASIAHEVNQPLSGIMTNANTCLRMLDGHPPNVEGARETVRRTIRDGNRAADVIQRLRALYTKREFTLEPVDLNEATKEVIGLSLSDLQRNRVVLRSELCDDLPLVTCDRVQVQQVILNLIRNATDAMIGIEKRQRQLLIRTQREEGDYARVTVRDTGVGLDRQCIDKLFDAFYTTKSGGMGIGLSVSYSIIERHHGRLWAEPNSGPGATFSFCIPFGADSVVDPAHTRSTS